MFSISKGDQKILLMLILRCGFGVAQSFNLGEMCSAAVL